MNVIEFNAQIFSFYAKLYCYIKCHSGFLYFYLVSIIVVLRFVWVFWWSLNIPSPNTRDELSDTAAGDIAVIVFSTLCQILWQTDEFYCIYSAMFPYKYIEDYTTIFANTEVFKELCNIFEFSSLPLFNVRIRVGGGGRTIRVLLSNYIISLGFTMLQNMNFWKDMLK